jgi:hypothetical protein
MPELLGLATEEDLVAHHGDLVPLRRQVFEKVRLIVRDTFGITEQEARAYNIREDFGLWCDLPWLELPRLETFHTDFSVDAQRRIKEQSHLVMLVIVPLEEAGAWVRLLPNVPTAIGADGIHTVDYDKKSNLKGFGVVMARHKPGVPNTILKVDGYWVYIPMGQMLMCPSDVYHSGNIRTLPSGNVRAQFYVYAENPKATTNLRSCIGDTGLSPAEGAERSYLCPLVNGLVTSHFDLNLEYEEQTGKDRKNFKGKRGDGVLNERFDRRNARAFMSYFYM